MFDHTYNLLAGRLMSYMHNKQVLVKNLNTIDFDSRNYLVQLMQTKLCFNAGGKSPAITRNYIICLIT